MYSYRRQPSHHDTPSAEPKPAFSAPAPASAEAGRGRVGLAANLAAIQRATDGEVAQAKSSVKTTTKTYSYNNRTKTETVGASMTAMLDPADPINGSAPGENEQKGLMNYLRDTKDWKSMKRGHLMNGQLGGPGIASNLFPITTRANNYHKAHVENYIKQAIANGVGLMYTVSVNSEYDADTNLNGLSEFRCNSYVWDTGHNAIELADNEPFTQIVIISKPEAGTTGDAEITGGVNQGLSFLTKNLPNGWGEKQKGLKEWGDTEPAHYSSK